MRVFHTVPYLSESTTPGDDAVVARSSFWLSLAYHVLIWAPGSGELAGDWGVRLQIDRVENGLGPDDVLEVTFSPPRTAAQSLVDVGVEVLQATKVDGILFDPDWREKVLPNVPAPEPEIATLYAR